MAKRFTVSGRVIAIRPVWTRLEVARGRKRAFQKAITILSPREVRVRARILHAIARSSRAVQRIRLYDMHGDAVLEMLRI